MDTPKVPQHQMSPTGRRLFALGLALASARRPDVTRKLDVIRRSLARLLAEHAASELGISAIDYEQFPAGEQRRLEGIAQRAIRDLDPEQRVADMLAALRETEVWADTAMYAPTRTDIIAEALHRYEALRCRPVGVSEDAGEVRR